MKFLRLIPLIIVILGNSTYRNFVHAEVKNQNDYKVLATNNKKLSIANVEYYLEQGDTFLKKGDLKKTKDSYISARKLAQLTIF